jgi:hypothetical protein
VASENDLGDDDEDGPISIGSHSKVQERESPRRRKVQEEESPRGGWQSVARSSTTHLTRLAEQHLDDVSDSGSFPSLMACIDV